LAARSAYGARSNVRDVSDACQSSVNSCSSSCATGKYEEFMSACESLATNSAADRRYLEAQAPAIQVRFASGLQSCESNRRPQNQLASGAARLGVTAQSGLICACQFGTGGQNCNTIPTPEVCETTTDEAVANSAGCRAYQGLNACAQRNASNEVAALCNCQLNPRSPGCAPGGASGSLSAFAGNAIKVAAAAAVGITNLAEVSSSSGSIDLSIPAGDSPVAAVESEKSKSSSEVVIAAPGAGSVAAGSSARGNVNAEGIDVNTGISGGIFNQLKTAAAKMLKGTGKAGENEALKADSRNFNPRGIASTRRKGVGPKNESIWELMNRCAQGESCKSNQGNYIVTP